MTDTGNGDDAAVVDHADDRPRRPGQRHGADLPGDAPSATVAEGQTLSLPVTATKEEGDPLTYTATGLPSGATLDPATGVLTWTPQPGQAGNYAVAVTAGDGSLSQHRDGRPSPSPTPTIRRRSSPCCRSTPARAPRSSSPWWPPTLTATRSCTA